MNRTPRSRLLAEQRGPLLGWRLRLVSLCPSLVRRSSRRPRGHRLQLRPLRHNLPRQPPRLCRLLLPVQLHDAAKAAYNLWLMALQGRLLLLLHPLYPHLLPLLDPQAGQSRAPPPLWLSRTIHSTTLLQRRRAQLPRLSLLLLRILNQPRQRSPQLLRSHPRQVHQSVGLSNLALHLFLSRCLSRK